MKKIATTLLAFVFIMGVCCMPAAANLELFSDVAPGHWSYNAISQLKQAGLITGYGDGTFRGDRNITRYEMAVLVAGAMNKMDKASPEDKALIEKLGAEYASELEQLGIRLTKVEDQVNKFTIDGNVRISFGHAKNTVENNAQKVEGSIWSSRILLNFNNRIDEATTAYARFVARDCWGVDELSTTSSWGPEIPYAHVDQYGIKYTKNGWKYILGKQSLTLGQGLLISTGYDAEWNNQFVGLTARGKIGDVNTTLVAGNTTDAGHLEGYGNSRATWFGVDLNSKVGNNVILGGTYVSHKAQKPDIPNTNWAQSLRAKDFWAVNSTINLSPTLALIGEYAESSYKEDNQAYSAGARYIKGKDTFVVQYIDIERNAIDPFNSSMSAMDTLSGGEGFFHTKWWTETMMSNFDGWRYYYAHQVNKNIYVDIFAVDLKVPHSDGHEFNAYAGINYNF